jgi:hypothetical protein
MRVMMAEFKVIYMNYATEDVYGIIRSQLPEGFELVTLERYDDEREKRKLEMSILSS